MTNKNKDAIITELDFLKTRIKEMDEEWLEAENAKIDTEKEIEKLCAELAVNKKMLKELVNVLEPFANYANTLKLWKAPNGITIKSKWQPDKPVIYDTYPCDAESSYAVKIYADDFHAAQQTLKAYKEMKL